ncbi:MAG: DNA repair protein RadC [Clostridia bacterium]|nr:DNA repair protein RadC [Clostridia bacterium]
MHQGHRERMRKKFLLNGFDNFEDHEILEFILFYAIPRKDTNEIAHLLIEKFGSLDAILDAPINLLKEVSGIGESAAIFIKMISSLARTYIERKNNAKNNYKDESDLNQRIALKFIGRTEETVAIMLLDAKGKIIYDGIINKGSVNSVDIYLRKIIELITLYNASSILIAHNHPSGIAVPSQEDIETTVKLSNIFQSMNINFLDHIIVADHDFVSLKECKVI